MQTIRLTGAEHNEEHRVVLLFDYNPAPVKNEPGPMRLQPFLDAYPEKIEKFRTGNRFALYPGMVRSRKFKNDRMVYRISQNKFDKFKNQIDDPDM